MAITNTQINNAIPEHGDTTPHPTQPNQALMNQLLKDVRDEKADLSSLGTAATMDVATAAEAIAGTAGVLPDAAGVRSAFGQYGLGGAKFIEETEDLNNQSVFHRFAAWYTGPSPTNAWSNGIFLTFGGNANRYAQLGFTDGSNVFRIRSGANISLAGSWETVLHSGNTTVDTNGFIKQASPIIKLHIDRIEKNGDFAGDFEKIDTGHYLIKNTLGLSQEGWYIETPKDANGNIQVFVEYTDTDGDITVKTYEPDYSTGRATAGEPVDIPEGRWIDIRLHELPPEPETEEVPNEGEQ